MSMRITFRELNKHMQHVINDRFSDLSKLQEELATGKRLLRPSDDPVDVANDLKLRSKLAQISQCKDNIEDGMGFMGVADSAMLSMNDLMQRLRELAIQASSDTQSSTERGYILKEVEQLLRQLVSLGNSKFKGDYVFGGTQTKIAPFPMQASTASSPQDYTDLNMAWYDGSGGVGGNCYLYDAFTQERVTRIVPGTVSVRSGGTTFVEGQDFTIDYVSGAITPLNPLLAVDVSDGGTFAGPNYSSGGIQFTFEYVGRGRDIYGDPVVSDGDILREIESGITMPINIPAGELTQDDATGLNTMETIIRLGQRLIESDTQQIENQIGEIDVVLKTLLAAQTKNGSRMNRFDSTLNRNELQFNETTRLQSTLEDAEYADTVMRFSLLETVYNAALKSASHIIQPSLVNFL
ncbi:MAG: flagellar hook-associated protein 3 [Chitinivibrionales bacterium]|nr:flagellar hook-associated protein 3 [Chitinivibrionales bacterium]